MVNIAEILKDKPKGTVLYSVNYGNCYLETVWGNELVEVYYYGYSETPKNKITILFDPYGRLILDGSIVGDYCSLFPSDEMRDWTKFGWKSGEVLYHNVADIPIHFPIFTYGSSLDYEKGDILFCKDCLGNKMIIIFSNQTEIHIVSNVGMMPNGHFVYLEKTVHTLKEKILIIRYATDEEKQLFFSALEKIGKYYDEGTKTIKGIEEKCQFKPFEKVIVRDDYSDIWNINFFGHYEKQSDGAMYYHCLNGVFCQCLPLNEETEKLIGTSDNW